jgi:isoquinoline 1-oxidoreductase beta subunit
VLNAVAEKAEWTKPLPPACSRHRAVHGLRQLLGAVAEVSLVDGKVKVHKMVLGVNCGHAVNPDQIAAQVQGSVAYGLSAAFYGDCTVENGRMTRLNFDTNPILRLADMPRVETVSCRLTTSGAASANRRSASSRRR